MSDSLDKPLPFRGAGRGGESKTDSSSPELLQADTPHPNPSPEGEGLKVAPRKPVLKKIHHVAYRCRDAKETADWYAKTLGMTFQTAFSEDYVPSTGAYDPYMHIFLDCGGGNVLAFFELPKQPEMGRDENTPAWVQHIAFQVEDFEALKAAKAHLEGLGIEVLGPTWHGIFRSIYFFDPNGHRLELACDIGTPEQYAELERVAPLMLDEWSKTKTAPKHADWLHVDPGSLVE